LGSTAELV